MIFNYVAFDSVGAEKKGTVEAINQDVAISSLQRRGLVISSIASAEDKAGDILKNFKLFKHVSNKEVVILSRQIATLFEAQVSALRVFRLLGGETENAALREVLTIVADDLQGGATISGALSKHPEVFSAFYTNMVKAGEEAGKLDQTFMFLADYMDRTYEVTSKARNALIYPAFVIATFASVMILMMTVVIPRLGSIIEESGQQVPLFTSIVLAVSHFMVTYSPLLFVGLAILVVFIWRYLRTDAGKVAFDDMKLRVPYIGTLFKKLYYSRISDNLSTMLTSGIPMVRALEITSSVVGNIIYAEALNEIMTAVKNGSALSEAFAQHDTIMPGLLIQMIKVGEETGELGNILDMLSKFYRREVTNAVDTLIGLIEPAMIVLLGIGVGILLTSVLIPIYNISSNA
jgi:type IV pilus assembly protein PilC